ncbi:MAG: hypothetical protein RL014_1804 [Pseudomonadota bacterium]|jgi:hypothetical protein
MKLNCKPGDLALVIRDEPTCAENIGRLLWVHGPLKITTDLGPTWLIVPVHQKPWAVRERDGRVHWPVVTLSAGIEHADQWLVPIRPGDPNDQQAEAAGELRGMDDPVVMASMLAWMDEALARYLLPASQEADAHGGEPGSSS